MKTRSGRRSRARSRLARLGGTRHTAPQPRERRPSPPASCIACVPQLPEPPGKGWLRTADVVTGFCQQIDASRATGQTQGLGKEPGPAGGSILAEAKLRPMLAASPPAQEGTQCSPLLLLAAASAPLETAEGKSPLLQGCRTPQKDRRGTADACQASAGFLRVPPCSFSSSDAKGWSEQPRATSGDTPGAGCRDAARVGHAARMRQCTHPVPPKPPLAASRQVGSSLDLQSRLDWSHRRWSKRCIKRRRRQDSPST